MAVTNTGTVLALDLGSNSIGWAVLGSQAGNPDRIIDTGIRIFAAGLDATEADIAVGRGDSRSVARRNARQIRRQLERRARRKKKIYNRLQQMGLLPNGKAAETIPQLDREILDKFPDQTGKQKNGLKLDNYLPYILRKLALDNRLEASELGRAFYNLAQHRGYRSNRKTRQKDSDSKIVLAGIAELQDKMSSANARTLGEYFASINPHEKRIRNRYTHRQMFIDEFNAIWQAQKQYYPDILTDENYKYLHDAFFYQRPLKSARHLIGKCELEPNCRRAPIASFEFQRFRYLQVINNIELLNKETGEIRPLEPEERNALIEALETEGDLTFTQAKKVLGFKSKEVSFNIEEGDAKKILGNRINAEFQQVLGDTWANYTDEQKSEMLHAVKCIRDHNVLVRKLTKDFGLSKKVAEQLSELTFEEGYANLSSRAIKKMLPLLEQGQYYATARKQLYGEQLEDCDIHDALPPLHELFTMRNPVVERTLTEMRKVVNSVIRKHGKPDMIRIELAREIKNSKKQRQQLTGKMRENERLRENALKQILAETKVQNPSRDDILKVRLADECNWLCPYTQKSIRIYDLVGESAKFDIEHIIPFSRCLDDSFGNKTLCYHEENRAVKCNKTPYEAYSGHPDRWNAMLNAVQRFSGPERVVTAKLRKFQATPEELADMDGFVDRQLNDTRYASKIAMQYLSTLYGGLWDKTGKRRVFAVTGQLTAKIRNMWDMNSILNDGGTKERTDHRHHAVDAVAVALTTPGMVKQLTDASLPHFERSSHRARFRQLALPWKSFHKDLQEAIDSITVSHRAEHRVNGPLHEETNYARVNFNGQHVTRVRRKLAALKASEVNSIANPHVREAVENKLLELRTTDPAKAFADPANYPRMQGKNGKAEIIKKVRINCRANPKTIGKDHKQRHCTPKSNHHMEIIETRDKKGNPKWEAVVVDTLEAMDRTRRKLPVVKRDHGPDRKFLFSIAPGDTLRLDNPGDWPQYILARTVSVSSSGRVELAGSALNDARKKADMIKVKEWYRAQSLSTLQSKQPQKIVVMPDGSTVNAND